MCLFCSAYEHFSYPLRPNVEIPSGLHLTLKCGTITALVGPSRAGRSTIVQLLALYYEQSNWQGVQFSWKTKEGNHKKSSIGSTVAIPTNSQFLVDAFP
ncbi:ABC transporter B family-like protein [Quillaja saponaria]|uniref:ABC transporter B family-like protein n=1 Tax=Quillaja saponaria TaxID=32244 RepID=A0AAD7M4V7_QUISA|nr:ABC transporter B family-like protein [Quillaja saponaria]